MIDYNNGEGGGEDNGDNITVGKKKFYLKDLKQVTKYLQLSYFGDGCMGYGIKCKVYPFLYL